MDFTAPTDYLKFLKQYPGTRTLTEAEEKDLAARIAQGDRHAFKRMVEANLRLVVFIARRYQRSGLPLDDIISEGHLGLIRAIEKYDPATGRFSTYASYWIRQAITRGIDNQKCTVRLPVHVAEWRRRLRKFKSQGRKKELAAYAEQEKLSTEKVERLLEMEPNALSLDFEYEDASAATLLDRLEDAAPSPHEAAEASQKAAHIRGWLEGLTERQRVVIERRFGFDGSGPKTLEETAQGLGVTRERIRQIEVMAMKKLRRTARFMSDWRA